MNKNTTLLLLLGVVAYYLYTQKTTAPPDEIQVDPGQPCPPGYSPLAGEPGRCIINQHQM